MSKIEEDARAAVEGKRQEDYGTPQQNHQRTAYLWNAYLAGKYGDSRYDDFLIDEEDVCYLNKLQKMSREMNNATVDGLVDDIGYTINIAKLRGYE